MTPIPPALIQRTQRLLAAYRADFHGELPERIHSSDTAADGSLRWDSGFMDWLTNEQRRHEGVGKPNPTARYRVTKALRMLRKENPREYECVYRVVALGDTVEGVCAWLNDRAERGGHPERYTLKDATVLIISGVDKMSHWA